MSALDDLAAWADAKDEYVELVRVLMPRSGQATWMAKLGDPGDECIRYASTATDAAVLMLAAVKEQES